MVRHDDELDVLDSEAMAAEAALESGQRLFVAGAGIDERERVTAEQPTVDRPHVANRELDRRNRSGPSTALDARVAWSRQVASASHAASAVRARKGRFRPVPPRFRFRCRPPVQEPLEDDRWRDKLFRSVAHRSPLSQLPEDAFTTRRDHDPDGMPEMKSCQGRIERKTGVGLRILMQLLKSLQ